MGREQSNLLPLYGLGISIVGTIVERHGGTLVLASPPEGQPHGFEAAVHLRAAPNDLDIDPDTTPTFIERLA